jgi:competence protein ComEA
MVSDAHLRRGWKGDMAHEEMVAGGALDLNTASAEELIGLIGISELVAESIIDFRDANGGFDSVEDLMEVEGLNAGWYERIRLMVTV